MDLDGDIDIRDLHALRDQLYPRHPGDLNGDGLVDAADLKIVNDNSGRNVPVGDYCQGDVTSSGDGSPDGFVGPADLQLVTDNLGAGSVVAPSLCL